MLKRVPFKPKGAPPAHPATQWQGDALPGPRSAAVRVSDGVDGASVAVAARPILRLPEPKTPKRKSQAIRDSARGEECTVRIVGACNSDPQTVVWSHLPSIDGGRGMGIKAIDEAGAYCCAGCHDAIDGRRGPPPGASRSSMLLDWFRGHIRSLVILKQKGLL